MKTAALRAAEHANRRMYTGGRKFKAWMPWILLSVFVFAWGLTPVKTFLNGGAAKAPEFPERDLLRQHQCAGAA